MACGNETPWMARKRDNLRRLQEAERVVAAMRSGTMPFVAGWPLLIEIARGESDRVIRTGGEHRPEIQTEDRT